LRVHYVAKRILSIEWSVLLAFWPIIPQELILPTKIASCSQPGKVLEKGKCKQANYLASKTIELILKNALHSINAQMELS